MTLSSLAPRFTGLETASIRQLFPGRTRIKTCSTSCPSLLVASRARVSEPRSVTGHHGAPGGQALAVPHYGRRRPELAPKPSSDDPCHCLTPVKCWHLGDTELAAVGPSWLSCVTLLIVNSRTTCSYQLPRTTRPRGPRCPSCYLQSTSTVSCSLGL